MLQNLKKVILLNPEGVLIDDAYYELAELYKNHLNNLEKASEYYQKIIFDYSSSIYLVEARKKYNAKACFIFVSSKEHSKLIVESLNLGMHTYCVKSIACNENEFQEIISAHKKNPDLILLQGLNNQWNEAAKKMRDLLQNEEIWTYRI